MDGEEPQDYLSDAGSAHDSYSSNGSSPNIETVPFRYLGLSVPVTISCLIPPEFDPHLTILNQLQREHHEAMIVFGQAEAGTIVVSVRTPVSKAAHRLQTTLVPQNAAHFEHLVEHAVRAWAQKNRGGHQPTGPSFEHVHYGAVVGRGGQTIRSCSPQAKLVWDCENALAGYYVVCVPEATERTASWGHQLRARLDRGQDNGQDKFKVGLSAQHPFGIATFARPIQQDAIIDPVVTFDIECGGDAEALSGPLSTAFATHTEQLGAESPTTNPRGHWLLTADPRARIMPPFESSVIAAEFCDGVLRVALAARNWKRCKQLVEDQLQHAGLL